MNQLYILDMVNKKRDRNGFKKRYDRYRLKRSDLLEIEKILWVYADAREMKNTGVTKLPDGRRHMPRATVDRYASVGRYRPFYITVGWGECGIYYPGVNWIYREDSLKFFSRGDYPKRTHYLELVAWPGIKVTFRPLSTTIYAQTHYATGRELMAMRDVVSKIENYLLNLDREFLNTCMLVK